MAACDVLPEPSPCLQVDAALSMLFGERELLVEEFEYYRRRVAEEDARARRMIGSEAELVHRALATHYAQRAIAALTGAADNDKDAEVLQSA